MPVRRRAQLGQHGDQAGLHAPPHQLVGRQRLLAHHVEELRTRIRGDLDHLHHSLRRDLQHLVVEVPAPDEAHVVHQALGVDPLRVVQKAEVVERREQAVGVVAGGRVDRALL